jgi:hypothetical protein
VALPSGWITSWSVSVKGPSKIPVAFPASEITKIVLPSATRALSTVDDVMRNVPLAGCARLASQAGLWSKMPSLAAAGTADVPVMIFVLMIRPSWSY